MKKGFSCPKCGNSDSSRMEVIRPDMKEISLLLAQQKDLRNPDARVLCASCRHQAEAAAFRCTRNREGK